MAPLFKNVEGRSTAKKYQLDRLLSVVGKVFEKHVNNRLLDRLEKVAFLLISGIVLGLLDQL